MKVNAENLLISCCVALFAAVAVAGGEPVYRQVPAKEVNVRDGIGNVMEKIRAGKPVTVVYFGGSITSMKGWRNLTTAWLQKTYPQTKFTEVNASLGGTGSTLGVFRLNRDALRFNPDLLFVEFATNDGNDSNVVWRAMEGIVRQTWKANPKTDIVFVYTFTKYRADDYCHGRCSPPAAAMELLADHYGISSVNFGPRVAGLLKAGKLFMEPKDLAAAKRHSGNSILFSKDSVHPLPAGHALYLDCITNAFTQMAESKPVNHASKLGTPFLASNSESAKMVSITPEMLSGTWKKLAGHDKNIWFTNSTDEIWFSGTPGSTLTFKFKGTTANLFDLVGPDGGQVIVTVDGKTNPVPYPRFDQFCEYYRLEILPLCESLNPETVHTVRVVLDSKQPDRTCMAHSLKDAAKELSSPKFQGTTFWPGKLLIIGELVK